MQYVLIIRIIIWFGFITYDLKMGSRENLGLILDFPRDSELKQILKWLPLDRGRFKVYFLQKEKVC